MKKCCVWALRQGGDVYETQFMHKAPLNITIMCMSEMLVIGYTHPYKLDIKTLKQKSLNQNNNDYLHFLFTFTSLIMNLNSRTCTTFYKVYTFECLTKGLGQTTSSTDSFVAQVRVLIL